MDLGIKGKAALVAAASKGIGYAVAHRLASEGATVTICARTVSELEDAAAKIRKETGAEAHAIVCDLSSAEEVSQLVSEAVERMGGLNILVTNSGGPTPGTFADAGDAEWQAGIESTLLVVTRLVRESLPHLRQAGWGRIVALTSSSVKEPLDGLFLSNAIRPAVHGLVKSLANELGTEGITVNAIITGMFLTNRLRELAEKRADQHGTDQKAELDVMANEIPMGRVGDPAELANAAVFLASDAASYITGTALTVDGGRSRGTSFG